MEEQLKKHPVSNVNIVDSYEEKKVQVLCLQNLWQQMLPDAIVNNCCAKLVATIAQCQWAQNWGVPTIEAPPSPCARLAGGGWTGE